MHSHLSAKLKFLIRVNGTTFRVLLTTKNCQQRLQYQSRFELHLVNFSLFIRPLNSCRRAAYRIALPCVISTTIAVFQNVACFGMRNSCSVLYVTVACRLHCNPPGIYIIQICERNVIVCRRLQGITALIARSVGGAWTKRLLTMGSTIQLPAWDAVLKREISLLQNLLPPVYWNARCYNKGRNVN